MGTRLCIETELASTAGCCCFITTCFICGCTALIYSALHIFMRTLFETPFFSNKGPAREGDTIVVWKLDRLGRSIQHLIQTITSLIEKKIGFKSLQENIDTSTSGGKLIFHIFSALAEFERDLIQERTQAGLKAARARGKMGGRPPLLDTRQINRMIEMYDEQKNTVAEICKIYNISRPSFTRFEYP